MTDAEEICKARIADIARRPSPEELEEFRKKTDPLREQRRYEIAKECVARLMTNERMLVVSAQYRAETAVAQADALLAELEKKP